ncbi:MAG: potassium channel protein [Chloroflexi bacterium]|nr:potassium channel protein [Chloroflexota bacterium]
MPEHPVAPPVVRFDREVVLLLRPVALVVAVVVLGVAGYMVLERWSLLDALYMVITTLTTVGYGEIRPLTPWGRAFTMVIIVLGVGTMLYTLTTLVQYAVEGGLERRLVRGRMQQQIDRLTEHVILCGYGRVGRQVAQEFQRERVPFVVVDSDEASIARAQADGCLVVHGNAVEDDVLLAAGIRRARILVTAVDSDVDNVYVTLSARGLNSRLFIVARASREEAEAKLQRAGADRVISPYQIGGRRMALLALRPLAVEFVDTILPGPTEDMLLEEFEVRQGSSLAGQPLGTVRNGTASGAIILAVRRGSQLIRNPSADLVLQAGDELVAMGSKQALQALERGL